MPHKAFPHNGANYLRAEEAARRLGLTAGVPIDVTLLDNIMNPSSAGGIKLSYEEFVGSSDPIPLTHENLTNYLKEADVTNLTSSDGAKEEILTRIARHYERVLLDRDGHTAYSQLGLQDGESNIPPLTGTLDPHWDKEKIAARYILENEGVREIYDATRKATITEQEPVKSLISGENITDTLNPAQLRYLKEQVDSRNATNSSNPKTEIIITTESASFQTPNKEQWKYRTVSANNEIPDVGVLYRTLDVSGMNSDNLTKLTNTLDGLGVTYTKRLVNGKSNLVVSQHEFMTRIDNDYSPFHPKQPALYQLPNEIVKPPTEHVGYGGSALEAAYKKGEDGRSPAIIVHEGTSINEYEVRVQPRTRKHAHGRDGGTHDQRNPTVLTEDMFGQRQTALEKKVAITGLEASPYRPTATPANLDAPAPQQEGGVVSSKIPLAKNSVAPSAIQNILGATTAAQGLISGDRQHVIGNVAQLSSSAVGMFADAREWLAAQALRNASSAAQQDAAAIALSSARNLARVAGIITGSIAVPVGGYQTYKSFQEGDSYGAAINAASTTGGAMLLTAGVLGSKSALAGILTTAGMGIAATVGVTIIGIYSHQIYLMDAETTAIKSLNREFDERRFTPGLTQTYIDNANKHNQAMGAFRAVSPATAEYKNLSDQIEYLRKNTSIVGSPPTPETLVPAIDQQLKVLETQKALLSKDFSDQKVTITSGSHGVATPTTYPSEREAAQTPEGRAQLLETNAMKHAQWGDDMPYRKKLEAVENVDDQIRALRAARIEVVGDANGMLREGVPSYQHRYTYAKAAQEVQPHLPEIQREVQAVRDASKHNEPFKTQVEALRSRYEAAFGKELPNHPDYAETQKQLDLLQKAYSSAPADPLIHAHMLGAEARLLGMELKNLQHVQASIINTVDREVEKLGAVQGNHIAQVLYAETRQSPDHKEALNALQTAAQARQAEFTNALHASTPLTGEELMLKFVDMVGAAAKLNTAQESIMKNNFNWNHSNTLEKTHDQNMAVAPFSPKGFGR